MYIRGGQFIVMQEFNDVHGGTYWTPAYVYGNAADSKDEAEEQVRDLLAEDDPTNPHTYKIFQLTPVKD